MSPRRAFKPSSDGILEAAETAFAKHGYNELSLRQLISATRVSTTAFYARFDSKEAVLAALTSRLFGELHADAPIALSKARDLESGIELGVDLLCERLGPRKALVRLILSEAGSSPTAMNARRDSYAMLTAFLAMQLAALNERKRVAVADPDALNERKRIAVADPDAALNERKRVAVADPDALNERKRIAVADPDAALNERKRVAVADPDAALNERKRVAVADPEALAWALIGALEIQFIRWAVWDQIDLTALRAHLSRAARAILPRSEKRHA